MLESLIGNIYGTNLQVPLNYGDMYMKAQSPLFGYYGNQANSMAGLGQNSMNLYGSLAQQSADSSRFNALAPALSGLLNQFSGFGGGGISIGAMSDPMSGYQGVVNNAYKEARSYDDDMRKAHQEMMGNLPKAPYMMQEGMSYGTPNPSAPPMAQAGQSEQRPQMSPGGYDPQQRQRGRMVAEQSRNNYARQASAIARNPNGISRANYGPGKTGAPKARPYSRSI